ncbi:membrane-targeted effector domain-containing toxin [Pseudomonas sp. S1_G07]
MKTTTLNIDPGSSEHTQTGDSVTLESYITAKGLALPNSHFSLTALADAVLNRALEHPLGNFGGGLSWPLPLSADEQRTLINTINHHTLRHPNPPEMGASLSLLEYLNSNQPPSGDALNDPAKALEAIISTPRAQALGQALQTQLKGIATDTSVYDYTLAALNLALDPESPDHPRPTQLAGFELTGEQNWGKPASALLASLSEHLSEEGITTAEMAKVGAYLLLARKAPELLIKDIPASVTYGSPAWVSLSIAAATIEAQTPGKVPGMTFAQVMSAAENASLQDHAVTQQAQRAALRVWGVVNGVISREEAERYDSPEVEKVRSAFNLQANERIEASSQIQTEIPSRKAIALAKLKERFGEHVPFEEKLLKVKDTRQPHNQPLYDPNRAPAGLHSLLDIAMSGLHNYTWESEDPRILDATQGKSLRFDVNTVFNEQFTQAIEARKKGIATTVKHLIAQLPLADRQNLEYGKLEFFQNNTYKLGAGFTGKTLEEKNPTLLVKATRGEDETVYKIDVKQGSIAVVPSTVLTQARERKANLVFPIEKFTPTKASAAQLGQDTGAGTPPPVPSSFSSARTNTIAEVFVEHLDVDNEEVVKQAKGTSSYDQQLASEWKVINFLLDLVPLRSAIVNFQNGNYLDGALDLGMDIFGFITAGAGTVSKVAKVGAKALSTTAKALQVAKILGTTVIGELNPLNGLGDMVRGGTRLIGKGIEKLRSASIITDPHYGAVTLGTFKASGRTVEGSTVLSNGQHYAYDPIKMTPYGPPLEDFNPLDTLAPFSPNTLSPRQQRPHRYNPLSTHNRPLRVRKPLPDGDYVESLKGKLEPDHFKPDTKLKTMAKFNDEMNEYYAAIKQTGLPPRPPLPPMPKPVSVPELLEEALKVSPGIVLGESHKQTASFRVLFDNAETLKKQGVKKVYFEGLIDRPEGLVDDGIGLLAPKDPRPRTPNLPPPPRIPRTDPTLAELLTKLADNGIEAMPLDHYYLTRHNDVRQLLDKTEKGSGSVRRLEELNYYAAETIQATSGTEKWVALVGHSHMNTSEGVPGIAELTGAIGIGVFNNANVPKHLGLKVLGRAPDPAQPISAGSIPGDLQIYIKPRV